MVPLAAAKAHAGVGTTTSGAYCACVGGGLQANQHLSERCAVANQGGNFR
jgi:hypothetical protein